MTRKTYTEAVKKKVKKSKESHAARNFFDTFVLLKDPEVLRRMPELREPHAFCIYCANIAPERTFAELHSTTLVPYSGSIRLRHGVCGKCKANT